MSILLTHAGFSTSHGKPSPPLPREVLCMSATLTASRITHEVMDPTFTTFEEFVKKNFTPYTYILLYSDERSYPMIRKFISYIRSSEKNKSITLIVWGEDLKPKTADLIASEVDMVILKHPYHSALDLISTLSTPFNPFLDGVPDIAFKNYFGKVFYTEPRKESTDEQYIVPAYDKIDLKKYTAAWSKKQKGIFFPIEVNRTVLPKDIAREIELISRAGARITFRFLDWEFSAHPQWLNSVFTEFQKMNLSVPFECCCRADQLSDGIIQQLKTAGCKMLWVNASGNESSLEEYLVKAKNLGIKTGLLVRIQEEIPYEKLISVVYRCKPALLAAGRIPEEVSQSMFDHLLHQHTGNSQETELCQAIANYILYSSRVRFASRLQKLFNPLVWGYQAKVSAAEDNMALTQPTFAKNT